MTPSPKWLRYVQQETRIKERRIANNKRYERRIRAEELIDSDTRYDLEKYLLLLSAAALNILSPFCRGKNP